MLHLKKEKFSLNDLINKVVSEHKSQIEREHSNKRIIITGEDDIAIVGDRVRLSQVLSNLISNAIKFTEEGSIITVSQKKESDKVITVSVTDTGTGIDRHQYSPDSLPNFQGLKEGVLD